MSRQMKFLSPIVTDLNAAFEWVSVPNVRTEVKKTAEVAF